MEGNKNFTYNLSLETSEVNAIVIELVTLYNTLPNLAGSTPKTFEFLNQLNRLLARQDFNAESATKYKESVSAGLEKMGLVKQATTTDSDAKGSSEPADKKSKATKKKAELKEVKSQEKKAGDNA